MAPTLADLDWPLRTERLVIRPSRADDAEALHAVRTHPLIATWAHSVPTGLPEWQERYRDPAVVGRLLTVEVDGQLAGELMVAVGDADAHREVAEQAAATEAELGWLIAPDHQGRGLATEAARALLDLCFGPLGLRRATASTTEANVASWRVMEKLGMRLETRSRRSTLHRDHGWIDGRVYALLAEEWPVRRVLGPT